MSDDSPVSELLEKSRIAKAVICHKPEGSLHERYQRGKGGHMGQTVLGRNAYRPNPISTHFYTLPRTYLGYKLTINPYV